jgi:hypothetical protein
MSTSLSGKTSVVFLMDTTTIKGGSHMAQDVLCEVNNCVHWKQGNNCGATQIYVVSHTGKQADNSKETDCKTFEPAI